MSDKPATVDDFLARVEDDKRQTLEELRMTIREAVPSAEEGFSYGLPAFRLEGRPLVAYGASKNHCSLYPMSPAVIEQFREELKAFGLSKGTVRFTPENPLPKDLVRAIVDARIAELGQGKGDQTPPESSLEQP